MECECNLINQFEITKKLYLSLSFSYSWNLIINSKWSINKLLICIECEKIFIKNKEIINHLKENNHFIYFSFENLSLYCFKCNKNLYTDSFLLNYCLLSIPKNNEKVLIEGFPNLGNSCYSGSILSSLSNLRSIQSLTKVSINTFCSLLGASIFNNKLFNKIIF